jgi:shikimate O-hydroxycinnamoyltransferase
VTMQITKLETSTVYPETPTEPGTILPCSICDNFARPIHVRTIYLFKENVPGAHDDVSDKLKAALQKLLVVFYPMAGRVRRAEGKTGYEIDCNDKGVVWVDAEVDGAMDDIESFQPNWIFDKLLVPRADYSMSIEDIPVQFIQVDGPT